MKLAQICLGMPKFTFMCTTPSNIYHYIPVSRHLAKKILAGIFAFLSVSGFACAVLAASMCQTFMPCVGVFVLSMLLLVLAYCYYVKAWARLEIPQKQIRRHTVSAITEQEYYTLLYTWKFTSLGSYCHKRNKNVHICEGTSERLRGVLASRTSQENGVFLIQELDLEALHQNREEVETEYQYIFHLPEDIRSRVHASLDVDTAPQVVAVPWLKSSEQAPQDVIFTEIPKFYPGEEKVVQLATYTRSYTRAFVEAIQRMPRSRLISKKGICLLVPLLGILRRGTAEEDKRTMKIISKMAFLQAMEYIATEAVLPEGKENVPIVGVLVDPQSIAPLRAIDAHLACSLSGKSICFTDLLA